MRRLLPFFFLFIAFSTQAQTITVFSKETSAFLKELDGFINKSGRDDCKALFKAYKKQVEGSLYTYEEIAQTIGSCNIMLDKKMRAYPYFFHYFEATVAIKESKHATTQLTNWMNVVDDILMGPKTTSFNKDFKKFLEFSKDFFEKQNIRYKSGSACWYVSSDVFKLAYDAEKHIPYVEFADLDLIGYRKEDSIYIKRTSGKYFPTEGIFKGDKARVDWDRTGLNDMAYCAIGPYTIETTSTNYSVDSVLFYYPSFFSEPIAGSFEDRILSNKNSSYPRFISFTKIIEIDNIGDNIKYVGGFELFGPNVNGGGTKESPATLYFYNRKGKLALTAKSEKFVIRKSERISSSSAQVNLFFGNDSIYHPDISVKFDIESEELILTKGNKGTAVTAVSNSYQALEMDVKELRWAINTDYVNMEGGADKKATFKSFNFFDNIEHLRYQNISTQNPIDMLKAYSQDHMDVRDVRAYDIAKYLNPKYEVVTILPLIMQLVEGGFLYYDEDTEVITIKDKVFHYSLANRGKVDYDIIKFQSKKAGEMDKLPNATINTSTYEMLARGVEHVLISDSAQTAIQPLKQKLIVKKNRDMDFSGKVYSGYGTFSGSGYKFYYDDFEMDLDSMMYFNLKIPTGRYDKDGTPLVLPLETNLEYLTGHLIIDSAHNKSGKKRNLQYPSFESFEKSYAFYQKADESYDPQDFYFLVEPFVFDSLLGFNPDFIRFPGRFFSANIFPVMDEQLTVQPDLSLGFVTKTPKEGLPLYEGKGKYTADIRLSNKGLTGKGTVKYLSSTINSDDITFYPQQMKATADSFVLKESRTEGKELPEVFGKDVKIDWHPYEDSMYVETQAGTPFKMFDGSYNLDGFVVLTPRGLYGSGAFDWDEATMYSERLLFGANGVTADTSNLNIKSGASSMLAFKTKNVRSELDFDNKVGNFKANSDDITTEMPYAQYKTSMNEFTWDMDAKRIDFKAKANENATFQSTDPEQEDLAFEGSKATYNLDQNQLVVEGVKNIRVGDAFIIPKGGKIEAGVDGMNQLDSAKIIADTSNQYHVINNAQVSIKSASSYRANGYYEYNVGDKKQEIKFDNISTVKKDDGRHVTEGSGPVTEKDEFFIDPKIKFKGQVKLQASDKNLSFQGFARMNSDLLKRKQWFSIDSRIDKNNVAIAFKDPKNPSGTKLYCGFHVNRDSAIVYPTLMDVKKNETDHSVFLARDIMIYSAESDEFLFGDSARLVRQEGRGNLIRFSDKTGTITAQGRFDFASGLKHVPVDCAGEATTLFNRRSMDINSIMGVNLLVPQKMLDVMAEDFATNSFDLPDVEYTDAEYLPGAIAEIIDDQKKRSKTLNMLTDIEKLVIPADMDYTFFFGKMPMKWSQENESFLSTKGEVGVTSIGKKIINKYLDVYVEYAMLRTGDELTIYLESPSEHYYYFNFKQGTLSMLSSNETFTAEFTNLKSKETSIKMDDGSSYLLALAKSSEVQLFLRRVSRRRGGGRSDE